MLIKYYLSDNIKAPFENFALGNHLGRPLALYSNFYFQPNSLLKNK